MAGLINKSVSAAGAIAYQSKDAPNKFLYWPNAMDAIMDDNLLDFNCSYWGFGDTPYYRPVHGETVSSVGSSMNGRLIFDLSNHQKQALIREIKEKFSIEEPELVGLALSNVNLQGVFSSGLASNFVSAENLQVGSSFNWSLDGDDNVFTQMIARMNTTSSSNSNIGMNIAGEVQVYGEPFEAEVECNLREVYEYVREKGEFSAGVGWFDYGNSWDELAESMHREGIVRITMIEGRVDKDYGFQLLEVFKTIFETINTQAMSGEGFFNFPPNPTPEMPDPANRNWGSKILPYSVSINKTSVAQSIQRDAMYKTTLNYTGLFTIKMAGSVNLAVACNPTTKSSFYDLSKDQEKCLSSRDIDGLQSRLIKVQTCNSAHVQKWLGQLERGEITVTTYQAFIKALQYFCYDGMNDREAAKLRRLYLESETTRKRTFEQYQQALSKILSDSTRFISNSYLPIAGTLYSLGNQRRDAFYPANHPHIHIRFNDPIPRNTPGVNLAWTVENSEFISITRQAGGTIVNRATAMAQKNPTLFARNRAEAENVPNTTTDEFIRFLRVF